MKLLNGHIYLETADLVKAGVSASALSKGSYRGGIDFIKDPADKRASLYPFDKLPTRYATFVTEVFGDPMDYYNSLELMKRVKDDRTVLDFYATYRFADGTGLPTEHQLKYAAAANFLIMLSTTTHRQTGHATAVEFYAAVCALIKTNEIELPASYERLKKTLKKFKEGGMSALISPKFGNNNREKLGAVQKAYLRHIYANDGEAQVYLPVQVAFMYDAKAKAEGWPAVDDRTVYNYLNSSEVKILCAKERYGKKELLNIIPVINRSRPSAPNVMWGIDGSPFELAYRGEDGKVGRLYVFMVVDYYSNKWLGLSISESETGEVVMSAIKQACTMTNALPHQIQSDHSSAIMRCKEQIAAIATFTPAKVGWARSKPIEAVQGHINSTILKWYPNHSGANITAKSKDRKVNPDMVGKDLPTKAEVIRQIYEVQALWNSRPNGKGVSPNELHEHQSPRHRALDMEARIRLFGVPRRKPITYTNEGITLTIDGEDVSFIVPEADFYVKHYGEKFLVKVDPDDTTMIGLFDPADGRLIEWAYEKTLVPMADIDHTDRTLREMGRQLRLQKEIEQRGEDDRTERARILEAETYTKIPTGVNGRFKDQLNDAAGVLKQLELVGVLEPTYTRHHRDLYDTGEGDTGRPL